MKIGIDARLISQTGVGRYIQNLIEQLGAVDQMNTYVLFLPPESYASFPLPNARWRKRCVSVRWHSLSEQLLLPFIYMRERLDLLHVPYFTVPILYSGSVIVTIHDLTILSMKTGKATTLPYPLYWLKHLGYEIILKLGVSKARHIICVSHTTAKETIQALGIPKEKISVIYEGIDDVFQRKSVRKNPYLFRYFLYVGNVYPHKQAEFLVTCFKELRKGTSKINSDKQVKLVFVGKKDFFYLRLEKMVQKEKLESEVLFLSNVHDEELAALYQNAIALLFPSAKEGFGLPPLEALACGCPVITMDIPIFRELLDSFAIRLPLNSDLWVSTMDKLLTHHYKKPREDELETYLQRFSWKNMAQATIALYEGSHRL